MATDPTWTELAPCLVTGGTGQIGSECVRQLNRAGITPMVLMRRPLPPGGWRGAQVEEIQGDLAASSPALTSALGRTRVLYHLAARVNLGGRGEQEMARINHRATLQLFEEARCAGVERFVHVSSVGAVGCANEPALLNEDAPYNLAPFGNPYFDAKRAAEEGLLATWRLQRAPTDLVIVNPSITLGRQGSFRRLARRKRRRPPPRPGSWPYKLICIWFEGGANFVDVRDAARGILLAGLRGTAGQRYLLGGENLTIREVMTLAGEVFGTAGPRVKLPRGFLEGLARLSEAYAHLTGQRARWNRSLARLAGSYWFYDSRRARDELGFSARPLRETCEDLRAWIEELRA